MAEVPLQAEIRSDRGKGAARKLRSVGKIPATVYGGGEEPMALAVDARELQHTLATDAGMNVLIDLKVAGSTHLAMAREVSKHPVRGTYIHVDFLRIDRNKPVTVDVPIHIEGEAVGVKEGGVLEHHLWQIHLECLPNAVPERIEIDVTALKLNDIVHVSDIPPVAGVTYLTPADEIVVSCVVPQVLKVEAELEEPVLGEDGTVTTAEGEAPAEAPAEAAEGAEGGEG